MEDRDLRTGCSAILLRTSFATAQANEARS